MPTRILMAFQLSAAVMDVARSGHPQTGIFLLLSGWPQSLVVLDRQSAGGDAGRVEALLEVVVYGGGELRPGLR